MSRRLLRRFVAPARLALAALALTLPLLAVGPARGSAAATSPVATGPDKVTLLNQSTWVTNHGSFHLRLRVTAPDPADEYLVVQAYPARGSRTSFDLAMSGNMACGYSPCRPAYATGPLALTSLTPDANGGIDVDIPVNADSTVLGIPTFYHDDPSIDAVYPIQVGIYQDGVLQGGLLTTFMVYVQHANPFPALSTALVLPVHAAPALRAGGHTANLPPSDTDRLGALADELGANPKVPVTLAVTPQTVESLAAGIPADQAVVAKLVADIAAVGDQVLPQPFVSLSLPGMEQAGLDRDVTTQIQGGRSVLGTVLGSRPAPATWAVNSPLDSAGFGALSRAGATQLIVPDGDLSPLPQQYTNNTFARPTQLSDANGVAAVYGADAGLTRDFTARGGGVLAANHLLAELAMIQLETPSQTRGVVLMPPAGWADDGTFLRTLLAGLRSDPLLSPVTAATLFHRVPRVALPRTFQPITGIPDLSGLAATVRAAQREVAGFGSVLSTLPSARQQAASVARTLLLAESIDLTGAQSRALIAAAVAAVGGVLRQISLPGSSSITLTSTRGQLPITVLSTTPLHARIELRVSSQRLIFQSFSTPYGRCQVSNTTGAVCDLTLTARNTTLKVPVQARSSGVFPLDVAVWSPDGSKLIAHERDTVRSTAVSDVGLILIIVAVLSLALWWARDLRHGRRARQLVPVPVDVERPGATIPTDPVVDEFFEHPPPSFDRPHPDRFGDRGPGADELDDDDAGYGDPASGGPAYPMPDYGDPAGRESAEGSAYDPPPSGGPRLRPRP